MQNTGFLKEVLCSSWKASMTGY